MFTSIYKKPEINIEDYGTKSGIVLKLNNIKEEDLIIDIKDEYLNIRRDGDYLTRFNFFVSLVGLNINSLKRKKQDDAIFFFFDKIVLV